MVFASAAVVRRPLEEEKEDPAMVHAVFIACAGPLQWIHGCSSTKDWWGNADVW